MKRFSVFIMAMCLITMCFAVPAKRIAVQLHQPDGTIIIAYLCGDEHCHFYIDNDGDMLTMDDAGFYVKATKTQAEETKARWKAKAARRNEARARRTAARKAKATTRAFGQPSIYTGSKKGLVILVNFNDRRMKSVNTRMAFDNQFNLRGYDKNNHSGSVRDYFYDQSYGKFDLTFDVVGPVTVSQNMAYYGQNDNYGDDVLPGAMVIEACKLADAQVNFKDYDWDGDGEVEQVYVIYAGYGEHAGGGSTCIWPHEFSLTEARELNDGNGPIILDGVKVDTYAASCELEGNRGSTMDGIGTACHEFSHCLGLPDLYDIDYSGGFGMNCWDVMDAGNYNGINRNGESPCGFSAYERNFAGWLEFTELSEPCSIKDMVPINEKPVAYKVYNEGNKNEYFILENRQVSKWFKYINGYSATCPDPHGMLICHVDYDKTSWKKNTPNDDVDHQRMSIVPADGDYGYFNSLNGTYSPTNVQLSGDLFPGFRGVTEFTNTSHINAGGKLFNRNSDGTFYLSKPITNICEDENGMISFDFMGGHDIFNAIANMKTDVSEIEYFSVNGIRVEKPTSPGIYITKQNNTPQKVIIR